MCGISGIVNRSGLPVERGLLETMSALQNHRGGDGAGFFIGKGVGLGHNRLSIIDIDGGAQPMFNEDGNHCLVYNGEIYNFKELRKELEGAGHIYRTLTDSEVILHAYEEWGGACLDRFRGMFAFAIWDIANQRLFLARDRVGIKPLYYIKKGDTLAFASEAKALLPLLGQPSLNERALLQFLRFSFVPENEETLFSDVKKLPAAHYMVLDKFGLSLKRYWKLEKKPGYEKMGFIESKEALASMLQENVSLELMSDVPVGILLSGGIDSSAITALAKKATAEEITTLTAKFDDSMDESKYAAATARFLGTRHIEVKIDLKEVLDRFHDLAWYLDDLSTADGGFFTTCLISEKVREHGIKVVLLGEGSDEALGGYRRFGLSGLPLVSRSRKLSAAAYYYSLTKELPWPGAEFNAFYRKIDECKDDFFHRISSFEVNWQLPNHLLKKVDSATMARSVEARVPFLDHRLLELAYSLPREHKLRKGINRSPNEKYLLREAMAGLVPDDVISRKKRGFLLPVNRVLEEGAALVADMLLDERGAVRKYFSRKDLFKLLAKKRINALEKRRSALVWRLFVLSAWHRRYFLEKTMPHQAKLKSPRPLESASSLSINQGVTHAL